MSDSEKNIDINAKKERKNAIRRLEDMGKDAGTKITIIAWLICLACVLMMLTFQFIDAIDGRGYKEDIIRYYVGIYLIMVFSTFTGKYDLRMKIRGKRNVQKINRNLFEMLPVRRKDIYKKDYVAYLLISVYILIIASCENILYIFYWKVPMMAFECLLMNFVVIIELMLVLAILNIKQTNKLYMTIVKSEKAFGITAVVISTMLLMIMNFNDGCAINKLAEKVDVGILCGYPSIVIFVIMLIVDFALFYKKYYFKGNISDKGECFNV